MTKLKNENVQNCKKRHKMTQKRVVFDTKWREIGNEY